MLIALRTVVYCNTCCIRLEIGTFLRHFQFVGSIMYQVGSVIRNPEIAALVPTLLISIADPNEHTKTSLDLLLQVCLMQFYKDFSSDCNGKLC